MSLQSRVHQGSSCLRSRPPQLSQELGTIGIEPASIDEAVEEADGCVRCPGLIFDNDVESVHTRVFLLGVYLEEGCPKQKGHHLSMTAYRGWYPTIDHLPPMGRFMVSFS